MEDLSGIVIEESKHVRALPPKISSMSESGESVIERAGPRFIEFTCKFIFVVLVSTACIFIIVTMEESCHASTAFGLLLTITGAILTALKNKGKKIGDIH